jgi:hypothetical protein
MHFLLGFLAFLFTLLVREVVTGVIKDLPSITPLKALPVGKVCYDVYHRTSNIKTTEFTRNVRHDLSYKELKQADLTIKYFQCNCFDFGNPLSVEYFLDCHKLFPDLDYLYKLWEESKSVSNATEMTST